MNKYAILILETLSIKKFDFKDDLIVALNTIKSQNKTYLVLKWDDINKTYIHPEYYD